MSDHTQTDSFCAAPHLGREWWVVVNLKTVYEIQPPPEWIREIHDSAAQQTIQELRQLEQDVLRLV